MYSSDLRKNILQLVCFAFVGLINTSIDVGIFSFMVYIGISHIVSNIFSFSAGSLSSFILNGSVTFRAECHVFSLLYILKFILFTVVMLLFSHVILIAAINFKYSPYIGKLLSVAVTFVVGFIVNKYMIFGDISPKKRTVSEDVHSIELWSFILALAIAAVPIFLVRVPPLLDYPNHYARLWLELGGIDMPPVSDFYALDWNKAGFNIGIDLIAALLHGIAPVEIVGPLVLCLALLLPPIGIALLSRNIHSRLSYWHVMCVLLGWSTIYFYGFLNFSISLGLALVASSLEFSLIRWHPVVTSGIRSMLGYALLVFHPFGFIFYIGLLAALTVGSDLSWLRSFRTLWLQFRSIVLVIAPPLIVVVFIILFMLPTFPGSDTHHVNFGLQWHPFSIKRIISTLASPFKSYNLKIDVFFIIVLFCPVILSFLNKNLKIHFGFILLSLMFAILSIFMPSSAFGTGYIGLRFPQMMAISFAIAVFPIFPRFTKTLFFWAVLFLLLIGFRSGYVGYIWMCAQKDFNAMQRSLSYVPEGSNMLTVANYPATEVEGGYPEGRSIGKTQVAFWHYPALAIIDRKTFIPTLFTAAGKQPISVRVPYDSIAVREDILPGVESLAATVDNQIPVPKYMKNWKSCFDYVLVLNADMPNEKGPMPTLPELRLITDEGFSRLYQVIESSESCFR